MPTVTIDNVPVEVESGATILDAAAKAGVWIPTLCYHPAVTPRGSCRLCMVELDCGESKQLVTACNYPVRGDLVVSVSGQRATWARSGVMELLLARSPDSQALKTLAGRMGVASTDYPSISRTLRDCILCGRCTSVCEEVIGRAAIGFAGRGVNRSISAPFRQPSEDCIACGACAAVCPVGSIQVRTHHDEGDVEISPFKSRAKLPVCPDCGAHLTGPAAAEKIIGKAVTDSRKFRRLVRLCPKCRRRKTIAVLALVAGRHKEEEIN